MRQRTFTLILFCFLSLILAPAAYAAGGGGGGGGTPTCKKGWVWDASKDKCVRKNAQVFPDSELIKQAWALAHKGEFEAGRELFETVADQNKPEVLNGLGYTNRKLGNFDVGIAYYKKALALDPNYAEAREYLGEGYVTMGKLDLAKEQLVEIRRICGTSCEEYADLNEAIETAVKAAAQ
jgi:tetratricopeptide (TPR) repeat protein